MNWYKKAQNKDVPIIDPKTLQGRKGEYYSDLGHDVTYDYLETWKDKNYRSEDPNIIWLYRNGTIEIMPESKEKQYHRDSFDNFEYNTFYSGRYSPSKKVVTILVPQDGMREFKEIPKQLQYLLKKQFPEAVKMIRYGKNDAFITKKAQQYVPIAIVNYDKEYGFLEISFNGSKKYPYENINWDNYIHLRGLLDNRNYKAAQKLLSGWHPKEDKESMLDQLYEEGHLK